MSGGFTCKYVFSSEGATQGCPWFIHSPALPQLWLKIISIQAIEEIDKFLLHGLSLKVKTWEQKN